MPRDRREQAVAEYAKAVGAAFRKMRRETLLILDGEGVLDAIARDAEAARQRKASRGDREFVERAVDASLKKPEGDLVADLNVTFSSHSRNAYNLGGQAAVGSLGLSGNFDVRNPMVLGNIYDRAGTLAELYGEEAADIITDVMIDGFYDQGLGPNAVASMLMDQFSDLETGRAMRIARTESGIHFGQAGFRVYDLARVPKKQWLAKIDKKTRRDHRRVNGRVVKLHEPFIMESGDRVMFPGDPSAPTRQIVHCRCTMTAVVDEGQINDALIWLGD